MKLKKKNETTGKIFIPNTQVVFSLLLFFISFVFSLCLGQKEYDPGEVGFMLTYFVPGTFAILALGDATIEYLDGNKGSLWNAIASVVMGIVEAGFTLYVAVSYFTKYPQTPESQSLKIITLVILILFLLFNVFARNLKILKQIKEKTLQIPLIHCGFFLASAIAAGFASSAFKVYDPTYADSPYYFAVAGLIVNVILAVVSGAASYLKLKGKILDTMLICLSTVSLAISVISILMAVNTSEFGPTTFYIDYWYLVSFGLAAILMAFPIGYMGFVISKKKEA